MAIASASFGVDTPFQGMHAAAMNRPSSSLSTQPNPISFLVESTAASVFSFRNPGFGFSHLCSGLLGFVVVQSRQLVFNRLGASPKEVKRKSVHERLGPVAIIKKHTKTPLGTEPSKEIKSPVPSRMRREADVNVLCGEVLKVRPKIIVHTSMQEENEESMESSYATYENGRDMEAPQDPIFIPSSSIYKVETVVRGIAVGREFAVYKALGGGSGVVLQMQSDNSNCLHKAEVLSSVATMTTRKQQFSGGKQSSNSDWRRQQGEALRCNGLRPNILILSTSSAASGGEGSDGIHRLSDPKLCQQ
nr:uncharacterized protein LOC109150426 [Ipomoea batatas]